MKKKLNASYLKHKNTIHDFLWRCLQIFGKQGVVFLIFILCARVLNPIDFGIYNYTVAIVMLVAFLGDFGISTATSRFVSHYSAIGDGKLKLVVFNSLVMIVGVATFVTVGMLLFAPKLFGANYTSVYYLFPLLFLVPISSHYDGIYRGLKMFKQLTLISIIVGVISALIAYFLVKNYGLPGAFLSQGVFYFLLVVALACGYREMVIKWDKKVFLEISKYSIIIGIGSIGYLLFSKIDTLFLGHYGYLKEIGYLEIINKIFGIITTIPLVIATVVGPNIAGLFAHKDYMAINRKLTKYLLYSFFLSVVLSLLFYFFGIYLVRLLSPIYSDEKMLTLIPFFTITLFTSILAGVVPTGFAIYTGHAKLSTVFLIVFGIAHFLLNYLLLNQIGFTGLVVSIVLTKVISDLLFIYTYRKAIIKLSYKEVTPIHNEH